MKWWKSPWTMQNPAYLPMLGIKSQDLVSGNILGTNSISSGKFYKFYYNDVLEV